MKNVAVNCAVVLEHTGGEHTLICIFRDGL